MYTLISGLGNPGPFYAHTRHQVGMQVVEMFAQRLNIELKETFGDNRGRLSTKTWLNKNKETENILLHVPTNGMNTSGSQIVETLKYFKQFYGNYEPKMIIVHDDMNIPFGQLRIKKNSGNDAGHNGIKSIIATGMPFIQLKIGIGRPPEGKIPLEHALMGFEPIELTILYRILTTAVDVVEKTASGETEFMTINIKELK